MKFRRSLVSQTLDLFEFHGNKFSRIWILDLTLGSNFLWIVWYLKVNKNGTMVISLFTVCFFFHLETCDYNYPCLY